MEDFYLTLSEFEQPTLYYFFSVRLRDGVITFQDTTFDRENEDDNYYGLILAKEASDMLIEVLSKEGEVRDVLMKKFSGISSLHPVEEYLKKQGIPFEGTADKFRLGA